MKKRRRRRRMRYYRAIGMRVGILIILLLLMWKVIGHGRHTEESGILNEIEDLVLETEPLTTEEKLEKTASENGFSVSEYPQDLIDLLERNPETEEFVLNYPLKKDTYSNENLAELNQTEGIPLLMQWDERWGYYQYSGNVLGLTGCGPTSLSMVASYLLNDPELTPIYMADYATRNGYSIEGSGTSWSFMSDGARSLGLNPQEVSLDENAVRKYLENGHPIICIMGEGIFTDGGHFIVFTGWEDGKIKINDPNRREFSERLWAFDEIKDQIKNMWVY